MKLLIFRHGETDWNKNKRFQGHSDIPLNETGRQQAQALAPLVTPFKPQAILTSDLSRAKLTAEIVNAQLNVPIHSSEALRECHLGDAEGIYRDQLFERFGEQSWLKWISTDPGHHDFCFPNGETKIQHRDRLVNYVEKFCRENTHLSTIAVSTHGGCLYRFAFNCINSPKDSITIPNCALYEMSFDRKQGHWSFHGLISAKP